MDFSNGAGLFAYPNLSTIISNQYLLPMIDDNYEAAVAFASRINGLAVCICGISMALLYDVFQPIIFFSVSASAYLLSGLLLFLFFPKKLPFSPDPETDHPSTRKVGVYRQTFHLLKKHWFLALAMCILAFTETSFNTNFDVIAFSLGTTPFAAVFLLGAFSGGLDTCASWLHPKIIGSTGIHFRWVFFLVTFMLLFCVAAVMTFQGHDKNNPWFLPALALSLEVVGIWWAIFISGRVRAASMNNSYGQTMAAFRVPRSLVTFAGVTSIGSALQSGELWWILIFNAGLLGVLIFIFSISQGRKRHPTTVPDKIY